MEYFQLISSYLLKVHTFSSTHKSAHTQKPQQQLFCWWKGLVLYIVETAPECLKVLNILAVMARNVRIEDTTYTAPWPLFWLADEVIYSLYCGFSIWRWCLNNCICVSVLGDNFEKYLEAFKPYLLLGLKNYAEYQVLFVLQNQKLAFHYVLNTGACLCLLKCQNVPHFVFWIHNFLTFFRVLFVYFNWVPMFSTVMATVETECDIYFQPPVGSVQVTS